MNLGAVAFGAMRRANQISRQRAIDAREEEKYNREASMRMGEYLLNGVIEGKFDRSVLEQSPTTFINNMGDLGEFIKEPNDSVKIQESITEAMLENPDSWDSNGVANYFSTTPPENQSIFDVLPFYNKPNDPEAVQEFALKLEEKGLLAKDKLAEIMADPTKTMEDVRKAVAVVNDVGDTTLIPGTQQSVPWDYSKVTNTEEKSQLTFKSWIGHLTDIQADAYLARAKKDPNFAKNILKHLQNVGDNNYQSTFFSNTGIGEAGVTIHYPEETRGTVIGNLIEELEKIVNGTVSSESEIDKITQNSNTVALTNRDDNGIVLFEPNVEQSDFLNKISTQHNMSKSQFLKSAISTPQEKNIFLYDPDAVDNEFIFDEVMKLSKLGASSMFGELGASSDVVEAVAKKVSEINPTNEMSVTANLLLPLVPKQDSASNVPSTVSRAGMIPTVTEVLRKKNGNEYVQSRRDKVEFGQKAVRISREIENLITPNEQGQILVKTGGAGILQRFGLATVGSGGQFDQFFNAINPDTLEEGTNAETLRQTARDVLNSYETQISESQLAQNIGQFESLSIELAYAMARSKDSNGRLSNDDFKIQFNQLVGNLLLANIFKTKGSLRTIRREAQQLVDENIIIASVLDRPYNERTKRLLRIQPAYAKITTLNRQRTAEPQQAEEELVENLEFNNETISRLGLKLASEYVPKNDRTEIYTDSTEDNYYERNRVNNKLTPIPDLTVLVDEGGNYTFDETKYQDSASSNLETTEFENLSNELIASSQNKPDDNTSAGSGNIPVSSYPNLQPNNAGKFTIEGKEYNRERVGGIFMYVPSN